MKNRECWKDKIEKELLDFSESISNYVESPFNFRKFDSHLNFLEHKKRYQKIHIHQEIFESDINVYLNSIKNEIFRFILNEIFDEIKKSKEHFIDITNLGRMSQLWGTDSSDKVCTKLFDSNYKNFIVSQYVLAHYISVNYSQKLSMVPSRKSKNIFSNLVSKLGKIAEKSLITGLDHDHYRKNTANILAFDSISFEIKDFETRWEIDEKNKNDNILRIGFKYNFDIINPGIFWILTDRDTELWKHYIKTRRDREIENILN